MSIIKLQRRDGINQGTVVGPSGTTYEVGPDACIEVSDAGDVAAMLEVGRPPDFRRREGFDTPGFWKVHGDPEGDRSVDVALKSTGPTSLSDPEASALFGTAEQDERAVVADEAEAEGAPPPVAQVASDWRTAAAADTVPCAAANKKTGKPCGHNAIPGKRYCTVHDHLGGA